MLSFGCWTSLAIALLAANNVDSIRLDHVGVPTYAIHGKEAVLECAYDLEGQALYSVKWYKNGFEFFRYLPINEHPLTYYVREGITVDRKKSDSRKVTLTNLVQASTGRYRCEVSTEAPSFDTASNFGDMIVVVLPESGPVIRGGRQRYSIGDKVDVNCTSANSKPAADILWFINGSPVPRSQLVRYPISNTSYELHTTTVGLRFFVEAGHFDEDGDMKLKCTASIGDIYWRTNEKSAVSDKYKRDSTHNTYNSESYLPALDSPHGLSSSARPGMSATRGFASLFAVFTFANFFLTLACMVNN